MAAVRPLPGPLLLGAQHSRAPLAALHAQPLVLCRVPHEPDRIPARKQQQRPQHNVTHCTARAEARQRERQNKGNDRDIPGNKGKFSEQARFYCGKSLFQLTPEPKLDQTDTYEAVTEFQNFIENYPESSLRPQAQDLIFALQDKLVEKEYLSAKLYYDLGDYIGNGRGGNYGACIVTAENAIKDYPYTKRREDFAILILRAKFALAAFSVEAKKEERYHNAIDEYYGFVTEYPESKYLKEAQNLFKKAEKYVITTPEE